MGIALGFHNRFSRSQFGGREGQGADSSGSGGSSQWTKTSKGQSPREETKTEALTEAPTEGAAYTENAVPTKAKYIPHSIPEHKISERHTHVHQNAHGVFITALLITAQMETNTHTHQEENGQIDCGILYSKEKE